MVKNSSVTIDNDRGEEGEYQSCSNDNIMEVKKSNRKQASVAHLSDLYVDDQDKLYPFYRHTFVQYIPPYSNTVQHTTLHLPTEQPLGELNYQKRIDFFSGWNFNRL